MDPAENNDFTILFRWKELAVSLNLTVKESKQGELFIHEMDTTEGKNWVPFQRRDLVRIKILKKNASSERGYKQTRPRYKWIDRKRHVFDHPPIYRRLYFSTSNGTRSFFPVPTISRKLFPWRIYRGFSSQIRSPTAFMGHGKSPPPGHIILSNKISWIG